MFSELTLVTSGVEVSGLNYRYKSINRWTIVLCLQEYPSTSIQGVWSQQVS